ncbi:MAG: hypothetical protein FRX48_00391 [Lasallia pustulata]|uniref:DUF7492 domain-containing protein n=1 Tax=Lasallia pustulata TaxID=136370 RepID=A0A5M8Q3B4_9LECA|nr:MAG: hypothetical protein FRX48_00391 [Lasallia pustulata]
MRQSPLRRLARTLVVLAVLIRSTAAHSWVEELDVIAPNGTYVGPPGYPRGYVSRVDGGDDTMTYKIPPNGRAEGNAILETDLMCKSTQQTMSQTAGSPRLQAAAGSYVALRYQENGHVILPNNQKGKPANRGTVFVYGTTQSKPDDTLMAIHNVWNTAGTGGDGRGKLLTTQNFDDGQCYQVNPTSNISVAREAEFPVSQLNNGLWCQNDIVLPSDTPPGKPYTLYWVWDWPTAANVDPADLMGKPELYTTCMDIDITASTTNKNTESMHYVQGQNLNEAAVSSYMDILAKGNIMVATQNKQAAGTGASYSAATQASSATSVQPTGSTLPAASSVAVQAPSSSTPEPSTYVPPTTISAAPVESSSQASSAAAGGVVTVYVTVSPTPAPSAPPYTGTGNSTVSVSPLPAAPTPSTAATPISSSPTSATSTTAGGSICGATKVQKRSRILHGASRHQFSKMKSGYVRRNRKSTTPRSAKFRNL